MTGNTYSTNFPTRNQYQGDPGSCDAFVTKLDTTQSGASSLLYSTYLGGGSEDEGYSIAVDDSGNAYVTGVTNSTDFPTRNLYQGDQGGEDAFVTKLDTTQSGASSLLYSTYLGGGSYDEGYSIAVDGIGNAYVTGTTASTDFPTFNQYQTDQGSTDAFVTKLNSTGNGLLYSTYLGGWNEDIGLGIAVDSSGNAYVTGFTYSINFPTLNECQVDPGDSSDDAFVTKLDPAQADTSSLLYSTYLGGGNDDLSFDIAVDGSGNAYVTGYTDSTNFPTLNQYQAFQGIFDAFVTKIVGYPPTVDTPSSAAVTYTTAILGGNVSDTGGANVTERGIYWSTTNGFTPPAQGTKVSVTGNWGIGSFAVNVTGLPAGTTIYFQAFAANSGGTGYSAQASFTTPAVTAPTVITTAISNITSTTADSGGNVTDDGGAAVTARGVCWSTSTNPTTADSTTSDGTGTGSFVSSITGLTPNTTYYVRAYATNSVGTSYGLEETFTAGAIAPSVTTTAVSNITSYSADSGGNVTDDGGAIVTARGVCWSTSTNPTTTDSTTSDGTGTGSFASSITGLTPGTTYYVRAYATNGVGTSYGSEFSFTTNAVVPTVTTTVITNITSTSADSGGNIISDGGAAVTARGVCWSTSTNPTTADSTTTDGTGTGTFISSITGLTAGTTYYVRAYATNSVGTSYGQEETFTAGAIAPTVTTTAVSNITSTSADSGGNVTDDGGTTVYVRGVCWSTSPNPTTADSTTIDGTGTGAFTSSITGLTAGTTYYVRAYATNSVGTAYGQEQRFNAGAIAPRVTTTAVSNITSTSANSGGNVTDDGGATVTARGVCWSTSTNPTINDNGTVDGSGTGSFTSHLTRLMENTTYYVRAYATNGAGTGYGNQVTFSTNPESLTLIITEPLENAQLYGIVTIKATVTSNSASASDASVLAVEKVEFYVDNSKIAEDTDQPYETTWDTTTYAEGSHIIKAVAYNSANQTAEDEITVYVVNTPPEIMLNRTRLNFGSVPQASTASLGLSSTDLTTGSQTILINNTGGSTLNWTVSEDAQWLMCTPGTGTGPGAVSVSVDPTGLPIGIHVAVITIDDPNAINSPQTVPVVLTVYNPGTTTIPFGYFETPAHNSTVRSSVPITGWVLDDIDITGIKIYRASIPGQETGGLVYIGDAVMVDGARPDVEQQFPGYPKNFQAGWGYMMLTNFLPFQGNGIFTIYAKATDKEGNEVTLGSKTITCANANAVKPFGAIDAPTQGGTASGSGFVNWGWVLTPQPNTIPADGSTISVWVNGVSLGSPIYNKYREDIATLFSGYNNSNGAVGYFYLDTTAYMNRVHTIAWSVEDNAGNRDGIGSRYFTILNIGHDGINSTKSKDNHPSSPHYFSPSLVQQAALSSGPVFVKKGYDRNAGSEPLYPSGKGLITIHSREDQRIEIHLRSNLGSFSDTSVVSGYLLKGNRFQPLPIGSFMDTINGIFYWQPCAGFLGHYQFVFVENTADGQFTKKFVNVVITAKY